VDLFTVAFLIVSFGAAPGIFYLWFFRKRDKWEREPLRLVLTVYLFGFIAVVAALVINDTVALVTGSVVATLVISAPIAEESLKWGVVRRRAYNRKEFNEPLDGLVYGAAAALGFASLENVVFYLFPSFLESGFSSEFLYLAIVRGLFSVPGHAIWTGTSCFFLGISKFSPKGPRRYGVMLGGLGLAIMLHATWNGVICGVIADVFNVLGALLAMVAFTACSWLLIANLTNRGLNQSPFNPTRITPLPSAVIGASMSKAVPRSSSAARSTASHFCPHCGTPLGRIARFCPTCGEQLNAETGARLSALKSEISERK
jgi:protease PrsW